MRALLGTAAISLCLGSVQKARAALDTWMGNGTTTNWSDAGNWGGTTVHAGDDLLFTGSTRLINGDDFLAPFGISSITYTGTGFISAPKTNGPGYVLMITNGVMDTLGNNTNNISLILGASQSFTNQNPGTFTVFGNTINMSNNSLTIGGAGNVFLNAVISGASPGETNTLTVNDGLTRIGAANTFNGDVTVNSGTLQLGNAAAIPSGAGRGNLNLATASAILDIGNVSPTINGLNGSGSIDENPTTNAGNYTITIGAGNSNGIFSGTIQNSHGVIALVKTGTGSQSITTPQFYSGNTTVSGGTLALTNGGAILSTNISVATNSTLVIDNPATIPGASSSVNLSFAQGALFDFHLANGAGGYGFIGNLSAGRSSGFATDIFGNLTMYSGNLTMVPGEAGTLTVNGNLALNGGIINYDLNTNNAIGGGTNDLIAVNGAISLGGSTQIKIKPLEGAMSGTYTLMTGTQPVVGNAGSLQLAAPRGITATFDTTSQPDNVLATVTGFPNPAHIVWAGTGAAWDVEVSQNWLSNGVPDFFYDLDNVRFDDSGTNNATVNLPNSVSPSSTVVSNTAVTYTIGVQNSDPGLISGTGTLTKDGPGMLVLNMPNNFTGDTIVNRGILGLGAPITGDSVSRPILYNGILGELVLGNGGIFQVDQANTFLTQAFTNIIIHPGGSSISQRGRQSNSTTYWVSVSNEVRQVGGTLDFNSVQGKSGSTIGMYLTNNSGPTTVNGIWNGWSTWQEADWVNPVSTGNGSTAFAGYQTNNNSALWGATSNINVTATPSAIATAQTVNSLRFPAAATVTISSGQSITVTTGGILQPSSASGSATITGGILMGSPSGDLIVHGYSLANTLTIASVIADNGGASALTKSGSGTLILTGNSTYTGTTYINGPTISESGSSTTPGTFAPGTIQIGNGGTSGSIASTTVNDLGTLAFNRSDSLTYGGVISGYGGVKQVGSGTTILTADSPYTGVTTITGGTLQLGNGGATGSINDTLSIANGGTLAFNHSGSVSVGVPISGIGTLLVQAGTVTLTTNESYTGNTTVNGGTLALGANGSISNSSLISIGSSGTLDVTAAGGLVLNNQAVLAAGNVVGNLTVPVGTGVKPGGDSVIGTMNLTGDLILNGGIVTMDVNGASHDQVNITGNLNLISSSFISINNLSGSPIANGLYKLIGYTGSVIGDPANLSVQFPFQPGQFAVLTNSTPNEIDLLVASGAGTTLTWLGDGSADIWNVGGALNFTNASGVSTNFHNNDNVVFNDAGSANPTVNVSGAVLPASMSINSLSDYTFQGSGVIAGGVVFKDGPDNLTILTTNTYSGQTSISNGTVTLGNGSVNGSLGSGAINDQANLVFNEPGNVTEKGAISGPGTVTLTGPGTVTLSGNNSSLSGPVTINAGTLQVGSGNAGTLGTGPVTNNSAMVLSRSDSGLTVSASITGTGAVTNSGAGVVTLSGANTYAGPTVLTLGTLKAGSTTAIPSGTGLGNVQLDGGTTAGVFDLNGHNVNMNGLNGVSGSTLGAVLNSSSSNALTLGYGDAAGVFSGTIKDGAGKLALVKTGIGTQQLDVPTAVANTFSGGLIISNGIVVVTSPGGGTPANLSASQAALGSGPITFYGTNGTLSFAGSATPIAQNTSPTWNNWAGTIIVPAGQTGVINGPQRGQISPVLQGSGTLIYQTAYVRGQYAGDASAFTGQVILAAGIGGGNLGLNSSSGWPNAHVYLTNGMFLYNQSAGTPFIPIGELSGDPAATQTISGNDGGTENATAANFVIGGLNTSTNFAGIIQFNAGIVKVGTGTLSLDGSTLTYTGPTAVSNGVLVFTATVPTACSDYALAAPGILDVSPAGAGGVLNVGGTAQTVEGNGTLRGSLLAAGSVYVGFSNAIGTLTVTNDVNLSGTTYMELNNTNANGTNDMISSQTMTLGGTLNVTNIGPALHVGDTFKLFKTVGALTGTFLTVNLPTNDANHMTYTWTDNTATSGSITVASVAQSVNPNPTNITFSVSGGTLTLSWPADHIGWTLQSQTNNLTNVWLDVAGSSTINTTNIPIDPTVPHTFYRLHLSQ